MVATMTDKPASNQTTDLTPAEVVEMFGAPFPNDYVHEPISDEVEGYIRRVEWCDKHGIDPFANVADGGHEAWQLVTDKDLANG